MSLAILVAQEVEKRRCERSLIEFVKSSWSIIEPGVAFQDNWHLHAIAEHLEAVTDDEIKNLVIAIPPGCMKSILVSVAWPAWEWISRPDLRYMGASYGVDLAIRDSQKCRDIITSEWYQRNWPHVAIRPGEDQKTKYALTGGGWRMATSVGGRATGEHPDRKIVDDPHNAKQAESDAERKSAIDWFDRTLSTRGQSRGAKTIVVAQRFHEKDVTGHILSDIGGYEYLSIPMEYDRNIRVTSLGWKDPRKESGELLWPSMFPAESVAQLKQLLGSYGASGQLQQDPVPVEGGILKTKYFKLWPASTRKPKLEYVVQSYDTAFTEKTSGDPTGCEVWGVFTHAGARNAILLDAWDEYLSYPELRKRVLDDWTAEYGSDGSKGEGTPTKGRRPDRILVEAKASGQSLLQDLRIARVPAVGYNPGNADKIARAHQAAPTLEMGLLWVPESAKNPGQPVAWASSFLKQVDKFPIAEHDEYVDCMTQVVIYLKNSGWFDLGSAKMIEDRKPAIKDKVNPYAT